MMKKLGIFKVLLCIGSAIWLCGCATTQIELSYMKPGEMNLRDVSKIAVVDFNSLPSDTAGGVAPDRRTVALVQRLVSAAFQSDNLYEVVELGVEPNLQEMKRAIAARRYNAVMYGRVWWQANPEIQGQYPAVMRLQHWRNLYRHNALGMEVLWCRKLSQQQDVLVWPAYRSKNATLMLSLVVFKLDSQGQLKKLADTFACADADFLVNNGDFSSRFLGDVPRTDDERQGLTRTAGLFSSAEYAENTHFNWRGVQRTVGIPNEAQMKLMLASRVTAFVASKLVPTRQVIPLEADFSDDKLDAMFRAGAYEGIRAYAVSNLARGLSAAQLQQVMPLAGYRCQPSSEYAPSFSLPGYVSSRRDYFLALGLCEEHAGEWKRAHYTYSFLFAHCPSQRAADGIGRCSRILQARDNMDWEVLRGIERASQRSDLQ